MKSFDLEFNKANEERMISKRTWYSSEDLNIPSKKERLKKTFKEFNLGKDPFFLENNSFLKNDLNFILSLNFSKNLIQQKEERISNNIQELEEDNNSSSDEDEINLTLELERNFRENNLYRNRSLRIHSIDISYEQLANLQEERENNNGVNDNIDSFQLQESIEHNNSFHSLVESFADSSFDGSEDEIIFIAINGNDTGRFHSQQASEEEEEKEQEEEEMESFSIETKTLDGFNLKSFNFERFLDMDFEEEIKLSEEVQIENYGRRMYQNRDLRSTIGISNIDFLKKIKTFQKIREKLYTQNEKNPKFYSFPLDKKKPTLRKKSLSFTGEDTKDNEQGMEEYE